MKDRIAIERYQNNERCGYHLTRKVPRFGFISSSDTGEGKALQAKLEAIPGVVEASGHDQRISIQRGGAYAWVDLDDKVIGVISEHFGIEDYVQCEPYPLSPPIDFTEDTP